MRKARKDRISEVAFRRQSDLTVILENVHDPHNIGAVLRSCDAVGISEIYVLYTEPHLGQDRLKIGKRTSGGARKWVDVHYFRDPEACMATVRSRYGPIWAALPGSTSVSLWDMPLTQPGALLFGNERDGLSKEVLALSQEAFHIPMAGMAMSLNISVACAVCLFEAYRQRTQNGMYLGNTASQFHQNLRNSYLERHEMGAKGEWHLLRDP